MSASGRVDADTIDRALRLAAETNPRSVLTAFSAAGRFVPVPDTLAPALPRGRGEGTGFGDIDPDDWRRCSETFFKAKAYGLAQVEVQRTGRRPMTLLFLDLRERHGVMASLRIAPGSVDILPVIPEREPVQPRTGQAHQDEVGRTVEADESCCRIIGMSRERLIAADVAEFIHPEDVQVTIEAFVELQLGGPGTARRVRFRHLRGDGTWLWIESTFTNRLTDDPPVITSDVMDISEEMALQEQAYRDRERLLRLTATLPLGVLEIDCDQRVVFTNDRLHTIVGIPAADTLAIQLSSVIEADRPALGEAVRSVLRDGSEHDVEVCLALPGATEQRICLVALRALFDRTGEISGSIICVTDITESARMRRDLEARALYDLLTGCLNRASIMSELQAALAASAAAATGTAVVFLDLDKFKAVNDDLGHAAGDDLLVAVTERVRLAARAADKVGRLGGDEFLVVCPGVSRPEMALQLAERIAGALATAITVQGSTVEVSASVGVAWADGGTVTAGDLVALADAAMYRSKTEGRARAVLLTDPFDQPDQTERPAQIEHSTPPGLRATQMP